MNLRKKYLWTGIIYLVIFLYFSIFDYSLIHIILLFLLFSYNIFSIYILERHLENDKKSSVKTLKSTLKKVEQKREESYHQFISLTKSFGSGLITINDEGIIDFVNRDFLIYFEGDSPIRMDYSILLKHKSLYKFVNEAYLSEQRIRGQIIHNNNYYDLVSTPIFDNNQFNGCLIIIHDITTLKTAERFQKQFTADVSHELKTPLSVIKGFTELLDRDYNMNSKQRIEFIALIKKESERMELILNDLLVISKMDRLDYEIEFSKIDIKDILLETINSLKIFVDRKHLNLKTDIESTIMNLDITKIGLVFTNIIKNAINYTDKGIISVLGYKNDNFYIVKIKDSGIGIDQSQYDNIFKRFYRIDVNRSRDTGGSGLGLSISKNVVLRHGGDIVIDSVLNEGTTFTIKLPIEKIKD